MIENVDIGTVGEDTVAPLSCYLMNNAEWPFQNSQQLAHRGWREPRACAKMGDISNRLLEQSIEQQFRGTGLAPQVS